MAIQMTRQEYEKIYGSKPVFNTAQDINTKPAPIRMTQREYDAIYKPKTAESPWQNPISASIDRIKDIPSDTKEFFNNSVNAQNTASATIQEARDQVTRGEITPASGTIKTLGAGAKAGARVVGEGLLGALKLFTTPKTEAYLTEKAQEAGSQFAKDFNDKNDRFITDLENSSDPKDIEAANELKSLANDYRTNPDFKAQVDGYLGGAEAVGTVIGLGKGKDIFAGAAKDTGALADGAITTTKNIITDTVKPALDNRTSVKRQQDLFNIENSYSALRKDMNKSTDANSASRTRIADANIWDNVVDTDGKMVTMGKGGAYDTYKKATIDGKESIVRDSLEREGAKINLKEVERELKLAVADSGLEGSALVTALKGVERELQGLRLRADEFGDVPLAKIQDAKISTTNDINYKADGNQTINYKKTKARVYKEIVENKSKTNVKEVNAELAKYYQDLELLKSLDGRRVKGGRMGKYFAQVSGNIIGGAVGGAVGGATGMAIGTAVGGELAGALKGRSMARSLGKGGKEIPSNPVLEAARKEAGLPPVKDLKTADKPVGAPKSITKTKEISKVEARIKKNVAQQKAAIKDGNFELVAQLKEVYAYLVVQLKTLIKATIESIKNPTIGLSTKRVGIPEGTTYKDLVAMKDYTDMVFSKKTKLPEATARGIANEMDVVARRLKLKNAFGGENALAKEAQRILEDAEFKDSMPQSKSLGNRKAQYQTAKTTSKTDISKDSTTYTKGVNGKFTGSKPAIKGIADPLLKTKREVSMKDLAGNKFVVPAGTVLKPLIADGKTYVKVGNKQYAIPKNQYDNLKGQSDISVATPFAPELKGTVETVKGASLSQLDKLSIEKFGKDFTSISAPERLEIRKILPVDESTKYSQYTLPGGENYREILIQAPVKKGDISSAQKALDELKKDGITLEDEMDGNSYPVKDGEAVEYDELTPRQQQLLNTVTGNAENTEGLRQNIAGNAMYQSSHWSEPNVISHIRINERKVDGKKYAFMEELQSDWAREGRDKGFSGTSELPNDWTIKQYKEEMGGSVRYEARDAQNRRQATGDTKEIAIKNALVNINNGSVPNNPLLKDWQIPTTKRALMEAVDSGADRFAWINGEQTSARYNLATHVDNVEWSKNSANGDKTRINLTPKNDKQQLVFNIDKTGTVTDGSPTARDFVGKKLDEVLGKGLADKIMEKETGTLSGDGLSFGGEWAKNLYDKQVRDIVKKLTGAEVKTMDMGLGSGNKNSDFFFVGSRKKLTKDDLFVGDDIETGDGKEYVITDVLGNGKFSAVEKDFYESMKARWFDMEKDSNWESRLSTGKETFDLSESTATQQYIELTPEVKAKIQSKAPNFKMKNPSVGYSIPLLLLMLGGGSVATQE